MQRALIGGLNQVAMDKKPSTSDTLTPTILDEISFGLTGFPRTGTTYFTSLLSHLYADQSKLWVSHDVGSIQSLNHGKIQQFMTLRDPIDTVISWSIYNSDIPDSVLLIQRFQIYIAWHRMALSIVDRCAIAIMEFESFTQQTTVNEVARHIEHERIVSDSVNEIKPQSALALRQRNSPSEFRDLMKREYYDHLAGKNIERVIRTSMQLNADLLGASQTNI